MRSPFRIPLQKRNTRSVMFSYLVGLCTVVLVSLSAAKADEPLKPLPAKVSYDEELAKLGRLLFFDPILSRDQKVSCASCHDPNHGGAESRVVSMGVFGRMGKINAPSVFNSYFNFRQFWDGRARDLAEQASGPIHNPVEMDINRKIIEQRLAASVLYRKRFNAIFSTEDIKYDDVISAIVEFEKTLITPNARFDRYLRGEIDLTQDEKQGYFLFKKLGCVACHNGMNIGGNSYQYFGAVIPLDKDAEYGDVFSRSGDEFDRNRFKVPSLRNVMLTSPYMHDGRYQKIEEALRSMAYHNLGFELSESEVSKIVSFLMALTGDTPELLKYE